MAFRGLVADFPTFSKSDSALGVVRDNETEVWEASQRSFDGCWPLLLVTYSSVSGAKRMEVIFISPQ